MSRLNAKEPYKSINPCLCIFNYLIHFVSKMSSENISIEEMAKEARNRIYIYINFFLLVSVSYVSWYFTDERSSDKRMATFHR